MKPSNSLRVTCGFSKTICISKYGGLKGTEPWIRKIFAESLTSTANAFHSCISFVCLFVFLCVPPPFFNSCHPQPPQSGPKDSFPGSDWDGLGQHIFQMNFLQRDNNSSILKMAPQCKPTYFQSELLI